MKATIEINDSEFDVLLKGKIDNALNNVDLQKLIETKINSRIDGYLKTNMSVERLDNLAKDRVSRILTTEALKESALSISAADVLSNLESKILLMIKHSTEFKKLVKNTLKNSL